MEIGNNGHNNNNRSNTTNIAHEGCIIQLLAPRKDNIVFVVLHYVSSSSTSPTNHYLVSYVAQAIHIPLVAQACTMRYGNGAKRQRQQEQPCHLLLLLLLLVQPLGKHLGNTAGWLAPSSSALYPQLILLLLLDNEQHPILREPRLADKSL